MKHRFLLEVDIPEPVNFRRAMTVLKPHHIEAFAINGLRGELLIETTADRNQIIVVTEAAPERSAP